MGSPGFDFSQQQNNSRSPQYQATPSAKLTALLALTLLTRFYIPMVYVGTQIGTHKSQTSIAVIDENCECCISWHLVGDTYYFNSSMPLVCLLDTRQCCQKSLQLQLDQQDIRNDTPAASLIGTRRIVYLVARNKFHSANKRFNLGR